MQPARCQDLVGQNVRAAKGGPPNCLGGSWAVLVSKPSARNPAAKRSSRKWLTSLKPSNQRVRAAEQWLDFLPPWRAPIASTNRSVVQKYWMCLRVAWSFKHACPTRQRKHSKASGVTRWALAASVRRQLQCGMDDDTRTWTSLLQALRKGNTHGVRPWVCW